MKRKQYFRNVGGVLENLMKKISYLNDALNTQMVNDQWNRNENTFGSTKKAKEHPLDAY